MHPLLILGNHIPTLPDNLPLLVSGIFFVKYYTDIVVSNIKKQKMGALIKYIIYSFTVVLLAIGCMTVFKTHPEVQFAFLMPGLFIIMYALIRDEVFKNTSAIQLLRSEIKEK